MGSCTSANRGRLGGYSRAIPSIYRSEQVRLDTFTSDNYRWPHAFIKIEDLAKDGFFSLKFEDHVKCVFCETEFGEFEEGDIVRVKHSRHVPSCPFVCGEDVSNIPLVSSKTR